MRRTLWGTLQGDVRLRTQLGGVFIIRNEDGGEEGIGCFDDLGHLFGLLVGLHVALGVVGQVGVAGRVPGLEQRSPGLIKGFVGDREGQSQYFQCMVHVFLCDIGHSPSLPNPE